MLTLAFFVIMALVLFTNLAAYISGAAEIISELLGISLWLSRLLFYAAAASVVLFGLKAVGVSEKLAVGVIFPSGPACWPVFPCFTFKIPSR